MEDDTNSINRRCLKSLSLVAAVALFVASIAPVHAESVDAIWQTHRVTFHYSSSNTAYSCDGLATKLKAILRRVGAHEDIRVVASTCDEVSGLLRFDVSFRSPMPATEANLRAVTEYDARSVLVARVRGEKLAAFQNVEKFPAERNTISLHRDRKLKLAPADCDLMRQVVRGFFSRMSVQTRHSGLRCSSSHANFRPPIVTVTALIRTQGQEE